MAVVLECASCGLGFAVEDIGRLLLISTGVCVFCYSAGIAMPAKLWCFGKADQYDRDSKICKTCPDNKICFLVVQKKIKL